MICEATISRGQLPDWTMADFSGYGYGDGYGSGYGYGYGDGYGYGSGDGSGYGSGSGDGYGYGYGSGDGYGYGLQYPQLAEAAIQSWPANQQNAFKEAVASATALAFWRSDPNGLPSNGGSAKEPARPGLVQELTGKLSICHRGFHATMNPDKWNGERLWIVALYGEVVWQDDKCAAMKREILGEIKLLSERRKGVVIPE